MAHYIQHNEKLAPSLSKFLNLGTLEKLPEWSTAPQGTTDEQYEAFCRAGFEGLQGGDPNLCRKHGLLYAGGGRINTPEETLPDAQKQLADGAIAATYHVGWGMEDDRLIDELLQSIIEASQQTGLPMYVETHRATIFQDQYRTVKALERNPEIMLNGDFSHWYTGQEMVYGGFENKFAFIEPVFDHVGFIHARIGNPGHIQVAIDGNEPFVDHFRQLWTACFRAFLAKAPTGAILPFTPEILDPGIYYASEYSLNGERREESDRWQQALLYLNIADECWQAACMD